MEIGETTETDREIGAEVAATIGLQEKCTMSPVRTAGKRPKYRLSQRKVGRSIVQSAFQNTGLRKENSDNSIVRSKAAVDDFSLSFLLECLRKSPVRELLLSH